MKDRLINKSRFISKFKQTKSEVDSIIIDLILEHFNMLNLGHRESILTDTDFDDIVVYAQEVYYKKIMDETPLGLEGEA